MCGVGVLFVRIKWKRLLVVVSCVVIVVVVSIYKKYTVAAWSAALLLLLLGYEGHGICATIIAKSPTFSQSI